MQAMRRATDIYRVALSLRQKSAPTSLSKPTLRLPHARTRNPLILPAAATMATKSSGGGSGEEGSDNSVRDPSSNPKVVLLRGIVGRDPSGWEESWEEGVTPWDLQQVTPVVQHLVEAGLLPKGRVLVPGCGTGYDVVAMASADRHVTGLDIANSAINKAKEWSSSLPNPNWFTFVAADFFTWQPVEKFDVIFDYTFFCAIDPHMRPTWAKKIHELLKPEGELITLIYLISDQEGGPPYNNTVSDYEEVLIPLGFNISSIEENELAVKPRKGREKLASWKRLANNSSL